MADVITEAKNRIQDPRYPHVNRDSWLRSCNRWCVLDDLQVDRPFRPQRTQRDPKGTTPKNLSSTWQANQHAFCTCWHKGFNRRKENPDAPFVESVLFGSKEVKRSEEYCCRRALPYNFTYCRHCEWFDWYSVSPSHLMKRVGRRASAWMATRWKSMPTSSRFHPLGTAGIVESVHIQKIFPAFQLLTTSEASHITTEYVNMAWVTILTDPKHTSLFYQQAVNFRWRDDAIFMPLVFASRSDCVNINKDSFGRMDCCSSIQFTGNVWSKLLSKLSFVRLLDVQVPGSTIV